MVRDAAGLARSEGIRAGDLIVAVNDMRLEKVDDFRRSLSRIPPGRTVALLVMRDGRMAYVPVRIPTQGVGSRSPLHSAGPDALLQRMEVAGEEQQ